MKLYFGEKFSWRAAGCALAGLLLMLATPGCVSSRSAASRIVEAPNHHDPLGVDRKLKPMWKQLETNYMRPGTVCPLLYLMVPVGPPSAELNVIEFPPQDYHLNIRSKVTPLAGGKNYLQFWMEPETNAVPRPAPPDRRATIFILHGYMLNKETMAGWAFLLAQDGYRVVLVDLRGHGQSTGDAVSFGKHETEDFRQLLDYLLAHNLCDTNVGVLGYSYGADLALHWAAHDSRVRTVVAMAPYDDAEEAIERLARELKIHITRSALQKATTRAAARMDIKWADWSGAAAIRQVHVPVLLIAGEKDTISQPPDIMALHKAAGGEAKIIEVPMANHEVIEFWFHDLGKPVLEWFQEKLKQ